MAKRVKCGDTAQSAVATSFIWDNLHLSHADFYRAQRHMGGKPTIFRIGITGTQWDVIKKADCGHVVEREYEGDNPYAVLGGAVVGFLRASSRATITDIFIQYRRAKQVRGARVKANTGGEKI